MGVSRQLWLAAATLLGAAASAQGASPSVKSDGSVTSPAFSIPYSAFASPEARAFFPKLMNGPAPPSIEGPIEPSRAFYDRLNSNRAARLEKMFAVKIHSETIAGVGTDVVMPAQGVSKENEHRVLVNLHGARSCGAPTAAAW
ncbi:hypothetical protein [Dyella choica]|uniref:hypothetical protein n=1 Tax=Dyella choica TaxID=1927959 RepID=UPI001E5B8DB8|nr:hypothetical protein [Dyella choica]